MALMHRVLGRSPRCKLVGCRGTWKWQSQETGTDRYTPTIRDHGFNAILGRAANQNNLSLQAVIPGVPKTLPKPKARPFRRLGRIIVRTFLHTCKITSMGQVAVRISTRCSPYCAPEIM